MSNTHLDRKALKRPDAFLERTNGAFAYIAENSRVFLAGLALLFLLAMATVGLNSLSEKKNEAADSALFTARRALQEGIEKTKPAPATPVADAKDKAKAAAPTTPPLKWEEATAPGLSQIEKITKDHGGTRAAFEGLMLLGDSWFDHGNWSKASEYYKQALDNVKPRAAKPVAQHALAYAYENDKQYDKAIELLRQIVAGGDKTLKEDSMMALARNYELKGDKTKALEEYSAVVKESPNSPSAKTAEAHLTHLK